MKKSHEAIQKFYEAIKKIPIFVNFPSKISFEFDDLLVISWMQKE